MEHKIICAGNMDDSLFGDHALRYKGCHSSPTQKTLLDKWSDSSVNCGSIVTDEGDGFVTAFKGEKHLTGKKYTVGMNRGE
jgi:hypothetical protein